MLDADLARPYRAPPSRFKRVAIVLLVSLALLLLILEAGSRIADGVVAGRKAAPGFDAKTYQPGLFDAIAFGTLDPAAQKLADARTIPHPYLAYALKPSWRTEPGAPQQASHNALGFRGKETTREKPPGVFRIVTLGGSSVYGQSESRDEAVWSARLEEILRVERPGARIEVINAGAPGYSSFEMLVQLEMRAVDLAPDLVVVYEAVNDMRAALYTAGALVPAGDNTHYRSAWPVDRPSSFEKLLQNSRTYLIARRYLTSYVHRRADLFYYAIVNYDASRADLYCGGQAGYPDGQVPERGFETYRRNLEQIISIAEGAQARVFIATQAIMMWDMLGTNRECERTQVESFRRIQEIQREVARARGVPLAETGQRIADEEDRHFRATGEHLFKNDVHPFDAGSELIARAVADALIEAKLLP
ncbi:MAG: SGNH/GDSL hydrolase family protein [Planctomycetota bacterium]